MRYIALDTESIGLKPFGGTLWMVQLFYGTGKPLVLHNCNGLKLKDIPMQVRRDLADPTICKIVHNVPHDLPYLQLVLGLSVCNVWDTNACEILMHGIRINKDNKNKELVERYNTALANVLPRYGFAKPDKTVRENFVDRPLGVPFTKQELEYAANDVKPLLLVQKAQELIHKRDGSLELALLENRYAERIAAMIVRGVGIDPAIWQEIADRNTREFNKRMARLPREVENWNSPAQVKRYFQDRGIVIESYDNIDELAEQYNSPELHAFIFARGLHKSVTSYGKSWFEKGFIDADCRVRPSVDLIIDTGRNSMSKPNLQQIPTLDKLPVYGDHRRAFVPRKGCSFVVGDFSGQEIGIMAAGSNERVWIEAMLRGDDVHSITASMLYSSEWDNYTEKGCSFPSKCKCKGHGKLRTSAKILNFSLAYGGGAEAFGKKTGITTFEAKVTIRRFKKVIPKVTAWLDKNARHAIQNSETYSASPYKRRRILIETQEWRLANQGKNSPIQGAGADMLKLAVVSLPEHLDLVLVVHDEIVLEVPNKECKKAAKILKQVMEDAAAYITGIKGLIKVEPEIKKNLLKS